MKKGFTMIEMMAVFTIAAIILIIAVPQITSLLKKGKEQQMESFKKNLYISCESYVEGEAIKVQDKTVVVTIKEMVDKGYINSTLVYPNANKKFIDMKSEELEKIIITVNKDNEGYYIFDFHDNR